MAETDRRVEDTGRPSVSWLQGNWKLITGLIIGGSALFYVVQQVNPQTIADWRAAEAKALAEDACRVDLEDRRWCYIVATNPKEVARCFD